MKRKHLSVFSIRIVQKILEHNCFQKWLLYLENFDVLKLQKLKEISFSVQMRSIGSTTSNPVKQSLVAVETKEHYL